MAGSFKSLELLLVRSVVFVLGADIDEEAIVGVSFGITQRLAVDRDQAFALFASGFRDQLLGPGAEIGNFLR